MITVSGTLPHSSKKVVVRALGIRQMIDIEAITEDKTERMVKKIAASIVSVDGKTLSPDEALIFSGDCDITDWTCLSSLYDKVNDVDKDSLENFIRAVETAV